MATKNPIAGFADWVADIVAKADSRGFLTARESKHVEFKQSFGFKSLPEYARTMAAFANADGGCIIFGVQNSPRVATGINPDTWHQIDTAKLSTELVATLDPEIPWDLGTVEVNGKLFGFIAVDQALDRPVVCKRSVSDRLREGEIYYRYHGQSRVIAYSELRKLLEDARIKERNLWMSHIQQIAKIGPKNVALLDLMRGDITHLEMPATFVIERELLDSMRQKLVFVKEGRFTESDGAPALMLKGDLIPTDSVVAADVEPEKNYPYIAKEVAAEVGISPRQASALIWKLNIKADSRCSASVRYGISAKTDKYSALAIIRIIEFLAAAEDRDVLLQEISKEYNAHRRSKKS